jgi:hypothetical protein
MSWSIACALQQLFIVMLIFQQPVLGLLYKPKNDHIISVPPFTNQTDSKLLIIHFHSSFVIFVSVRESMR